MIFMVVLCGCEGVLPVGFGSALRRTDLSLLVVLLTLSMVVLGKPNETIGVPSQSQQRCAFDSETGLFYDGVQFSYLKAVVYYQPGANHDNFLDNVNLSVIDADFGRVVQAGFNAVKLEIPWGSILTSNAVPYVWNEANLAKLDTLVQAARSKNLYVILYLSFSKIPQGVDGKNYLARSFLTKSEDWNAWRSYSNKLVERYRGSRNFVALNTGEPTIGISMQWGFDSPYNLATWTSYLIGINSDINYWRDLWKDDVEVDSNNYIRFPRFWVAPNGTRLTRPFLSTYAKWRTYFEWLTRLVNQRITQLYNDAMSANPNIMFLYNMRPNEPVYAKEGWFYFSHDDSFNRNLPHAYYSFGRYPSQSSGGVTNTTQIEVEAQNAVSYSGKPMFLTELGASSYLFGLEPQATWYRNVLNLVAQRQRKIAGYAAWCWIDHTNHPSPEQSAYGLLYANGSAKPALDVVSQMNRRELGVTISTTTATISTLTTTTTTTTGAITQHCAIASAAYGSEMAPQIQFLREFRDRTVVSTFAGARFISVFNAFYYSFSPILAQGALANPAIAGLIRALIGPMLAALRLGSSIFHMFPLNPELAILIAGSSASGLIGVIYATPFFAIFWLIGMRSKNERLELL